MSLVKSFSEKIKKNQKKKLQRKNSILSIKNNIDELYDLVYQITASISKNEHANPLNSFGKKCFSQSDEDGITIEIFKRLKNLNSGSFLELGVGDGTENNTLILLSLGWNGFWVGGSDLAFDTSNSKKLKCDHNKQDGRFSIIMPNVSLSENLSKVEIEQFPFIFFNFINNSVKAEIINEIRNRKEAEILRKQRELQELKNSIKIEKSQMKDQYINTLKELNLHLEIAQTNNIISPQKDAPGFSSNLAMGGYNTELLYKNGVTALTLFIDSIEERYQAELLESLTLQAMSRDIVYIESSLESIGDMDFININEENDFFEVLKFEVDNEYLTTFSKPNFNFLITLFLSFGIILVSVILLEGYKSRQSLLKN